MHNSIPLRISFVLFLLQVVVVFTGYSETIKSKATGNWGDASTWQPAKVPTASDVVVISNGNTVSIDIVSAYCSALILETGSKPTVLSILATNTLNVSGNIDIYDGDPANILAVNGGTLNVGGNVTIYGNGNKSGKLTVSTGKVEVIGNFGFVAIGVGNEDNKVVDVTESGVIIIGGQFLNSGSGTITPASIDNIFIRQSYFKSAASGDWNTPSSWLISKDNITYYSSPVIPNASALGIQVVYPHVITLSTNSPAAQLVVDGTLVCNNYIVNGPGPVTINDNATLSTSNADGLALTGLIGTVQVDGVRTYSSNANYTFTGSADQCTGPGFPSILNGILTVNKNTQLLKLTVCKPLIVTKRVDVNKGELNSNGNLTLQATAENHANIGYLSSEANVTGDVNIQVFMAGGYRSARLLSSPINLPSQVFRQLQKYILVTGPGGVTNGFDKGGLGQPYAVTLNLFNESLSSAQANFVPVSNIQNSIASGVGFHAFFRGKRGATELENYPKLNRPYSIPEDVTVTYSGPINKFDINKITLTKAGNASNSFDGYNLLGNPYPSTIDYHQIPLGTTIKDQLMIIKPNGAQATYIKGAAISNNGGTRYIQPGQGFFLIANSTAELIFKESFKSTSNDSYRFIVTPKERLMTNGVNVSNETKSIKILKLNLQDNINFDETTIAFKEDEFVKADFEDAPYISGSTVSLFSLKNNKAFAINFMPPKSEIKEIKLFINSSSTGPLKMNFTDVSGTSGYSVFLKDSVFPDTLFDVKKAPAYSFEVNKADPKTYGSDRFSIIFKLDPPSLFLAKRSNSKVQLTWTSNVPKVIQFFSIEVSTDNVNFKSLGQVSTSGNTLVDAKYSFIDKVPSTGVNYYRIKQVTKNGDISFTKSEVVNFDSKASLGFVKELLIFPNPSSENIYFSIDRPHDDEIEACIYDIQGKKIETTIFSATDNLSLKVDQLSKGVYFLELKKNKNKDLLGHAKFVVGI